MTFDQLNEYYDQFGDAFPTSQLKGYSEEEQEQMLQECLDKNKSYDELYETDNTVDY